MILKIELLKNDGTVIYQGVHDALENIEWLPYRLEDTREETERPKESIIFNGFRYYPYFSRVPDISLPPDLEKPD